MPWVAHGVICALITHLLSVHVLAHGLGRVVGNDSWIRTGSNPDSVRGPNACYFSYERLPKGKVPRGLLNVVPELVIEVRSASDTWDAIFSKVGEYLTAGVRIVVIVDPESETASVYRRDEFQQTFHNGDPLVLPDLLPGFSVPVTRLFE